MISSVFRTLTAAAALSCCAGVALAQNTAADQAADLPVGEPATPADGVGQPYLREEFTDWQLICVRVEEGPEPCNIQQTVFDANNNPVVQFSLAPLPAEAAPRAAAAEVATPLETLLREDVLLGVDGGQAKKYRYTFCATNGCYARFALTLEEVEAFRRGAAATIVIVPLVAPDQRAELKVSLSGFTAAFAAALEANEQ